VGIDLIVSGRVAPHLKRDADVHLMSDDALIATVESLGGVKPGVLRNTELRAMVLPAMRNDCRAIETYRCEPAAPITALVGIDDPIVSVPDAGEWAWHTTGSFTLETLPGGHFFPVSQWGTVADLVRCEICGSVGPRRAQDL
jgi:pyochelin biosynthetic protein PchC